MIDAALPHIIDKLKKILRNSAAPQDDTMINLDAILLMQQRLETLKKKREREKPYLGGTSLIKELEALINRFHIRTNADNSEVPLK